jgi:hypothetical protein
VLKNENDVQRPPESIGEPAIVSGIDIERAAALREAEFVGLARAEQSQLAYREAASCLKRTVRKRTRKVASKPRR